LVEQARSERDELLREDAANIRALLIEWRSGQERSERYALQLLPLADKQAKRSWPLIVAEKPLG
jgi:hypothetical protein